MSGEDDKTGAESAEDTADSLIRAVAQAPKRQLDDLRTRSVPGSASTAVDYARVDVPEVGSVVDGRYALERVLGAGGMGVVYEARNVLTQKRVALKYLVVPAGRGHQAGQRAARFLREARAAGRVRHPNVVDMIDVGGDPARPYLVMELLKGQSLWGRMSAGPLPAEEALFIMLSAMRGVAEAHRQGVIHRDLKPENIFLAEAEDGRVTPKVLDFGVSRITTGADEARPTTLTRAGNVVGTPSYMPLEQLRGNADVDVRADVYSLGVVLYEALAGRRPFEAQNEHDLGIKMATEQPTRLSAVLKNVDPHVEAAVMRALGRAPEDRHPSVEAFIAALENRVAGRRRPWQVRLSLWAAVIVVLAGLAAWGALGTEPKRAAQPSTLPAKITSAPTQDWKEGRALGKPELPAQGSAPSAPSERLEVPLSAEQGSSAPAPLRRSGRAKPQTAEVPTPAEGAAPIERAKLLLPKDF